MSSRQILKIVGVVTIVLSANSPSAVRAQLVTEVPVESDGVLVLAFSPDGRLLAGGGLEKKVRIWDMQTNKLLRKLEEPAGIVRAVAFSPDGKTLAAGSDDETIYLWETSSGKLLKKLKEASWIRTLTFSPDGKWMAVATVQAQEDADDRFIREVKIRDATTGKIKRTIFREDGSTGGLSFSPDSKTLATGHYREFAGIKLWDVDSGKEKQRLTLQRGYLDAIAFSPDGLTVASAGGYAVQRDQGAELKAEIILWDVKTGKPSRSLSGTGLFRSIAFSADGKNVLSGNQGPIKEYNNGAQKVVSELKLWEVATGKLLWNVEGELGDVRSVAFSPDGKTIASCDSENVKLSEPQNGMVREILMTRTLRFAPRSRPEPNARGCLGQNAVMAR